MKLRLAVILLFIATSVSAQKSGQTDWEFGLSGGIMWYNGDLNPDVMFGQAYIHESYGFNIRRNLNQRWALRFDGNYGQLSANDNLSTDPAQIQRNLNFQTNIWELASMIEFNFLEYDALIKKYKFSPYTFIGLGVFRFNPETNIEGNIYQLRPLTTEGHTYWLTNVNIPFGLGFKLAITDRIIVSTDWGMRRTFSDYIDDVSDMYPDQGELSGLAEDLSDRSLRIIGVDGTNWGTQRGDAQTTDWFSVVKFTLAVRLGPKKGSCKHLRI